MKGGKTNFSQRVNVAAQLGQNLFNLFPMQDCIEEWGECWLLRGHVLCKKIYWISELTLQHFDQKTTFNFSSSTYVVYRILYTYF